MLIQLKSVLLCDKEVLFILDRAEYQIVFINNYFTESVCLIAASHWQDPGRSRVSLTEPIHFAVSEIESGSLESTSL